MNGYSLASSVIHEDFSSQMTSVLTDRYSFAYTDNDFLGTPYSTSLFDNPHFQKGQFL